MAELSTEITELISSATPILVEAGFSLEFCTEDEVKGVKGLSQPQKKALIMDIRKRAKLSQKGNFLSNSVPAISGYLYWKGYFGDWNSRYVELYDDLIIHRFVKGGMEWGRYKLHSRTKCDDHSDRHFCFVVADPITKEKLLLAATNTSLKEAWTEAIQNALTMLRMAERKLKFGDYHKLLNDEQNLKHTIYIRIIQARNLLGKDTQGMSNPYVKVRMGSATARTTTRKRNLNPDWGMVFPFCWDGSMRYARIEVWDEDAKSGDQFLGMTLLPLFSLKDGDTFSSWYPLGKRSTRSTVGGDIEIELTCSGMPDNDSKAWRLFYQIQQLPEFSLNLAASEDGNGQIALDFDGVQMPLTDKSGQMRSLVGDTDSATSSDDEDNSGEPRTSSIIRKLNTESCLPASSMLHGFPLYYPPIELEHLEDFSLRVHMKCMVNAAKLSVAGLLILTNYRLIFLPNYRIAVAYTTDTRGRAYSDPQSQIHSSVTNSPIQLPRRDVDLSTQILISCISDIAFTTDLEDSGPYTGSNFETVRLTTTDCRKITFQFVEDVDQLSNRHQHVINKTFGNILRGVNDNFQNVADNIHRKKTSVLNEIHNLNSAFVKTITGDNTPLSRCSSPMVPGSLGSEHDSGCVGSNGENTPKGKARKTGSSSALQTMATANGKNAVRLASIAAGTMGLSELEKCWLRLVGENINLVEALDSEEGTPGQRIHHRIKWRVINRACEKSSAINTNMTLLHTLRTACGQNPSAPQYFFQSVSEYDAVAAAAHRLTSSALDSTHSPQLLPLGWMSVDGGAGQQSITLSKTERLRQQCTLHALEKKIAQTEPLLNVYTKLLYNVENSWLMFDPHNEFKRMGVPNNMWRVTYVNVQYELCETYPAVLAVPKSVDDDTLIAAASFRSKNRFPALCWRSMVNNATISRSSQPMIGLGNSRNAADEFLLREINKASLGSSDDLSVGFGSRSPSLVGGDSRGGSFSGLQLSEKSSSTLPLGQTVVRRYVITDARPLLNARANQAAGKGVESDKVYENCSVVFLDIANIHAMRKSLEMMVEANSGDDVNWIRNVEAAGWLGHVRKVLLGASKIAHFLSYENLSVLVHCSDGWDRTSQLTSLSMLMMDGYYRTLKGFIVLIEKEWLSFGHKFADRTGWSSEGFADDERSPIFAQFLDCVHQFLVQMPDAFEFNQDLLLFLVTHLHSGWFGNFLFNSEYELKFHVSHKALLSIWTVVLGNRTRYKNPSYIPRESPVVPVVSKSKLAVWSGWFLSWQDKVWAASWIENNQLGVKVEARVIDGKTCFKCEAAFTFTHRKHHCRCCAQIFCYNCCHARRIVPSTGISYKTRCCNECALLIDMDYFNETDNSHSGLTVDDARTNPQLTSFRHSLTQRPVVD